MVSGSCYRLAEELAQRGHSVHFVALPSYFPPQNHYRMENGVHCYRYNPPAPPFFYKRGIRRVLRILKVLIGIHYKQKLNAVVDNIIDNNNIKLIESTNAQGC